MEQPNLNYIYNMSGGNKDFEKKITDIIKTEFPEEKAIYFKNLEASNYKQTAEIVHKLKHKISILGLEKSYAIAVDYENNLIERSTKGKIEFEAILQSITDFLKTL